MEFLTISETENFGLTGHIYKYTLLINKEISVKITIIAVGKLKEKFLRDGVNEYKKKLSHFCKLEIIEVNDEPIPDNPNPSQESQVKGKEAKSILSKVKDGSWIVVLDIKGVKMSSEKLASELDKWMISGKSDITFIIGGSLGLGEEVLKKANVSLSLSDMTFPHQLARLILVEQIYRAFKIIRGETYHK